jgi:hypothetical protein
MGGGYFIPPVLQRSVEAVLEMPERARGEFQSLYVRNRELACRHCRALRYRTNIAATPTGRARIARSKLLAAMSALPRRETFRWQPYRSRSWHLRLVRHMGQLDKSRRANLSNWLDR